MCHSISCQFGVVVVVVRRSESVFLFFFLFVFFILETLYDGPSRSSAEITSFLHARPNIHHNIIWSMRIAEILIQKMYSFSA